MQYRIRLRLRCDRPAARENPVFWPQPWALPCPFPRCCLAGVGAPRLPTRQRRPQRPSYAEYYLTKSIYYGNQANGAGVCAAGYHFASLWEIMQTATLSCNTTLGATLPDSGDGPPTGNGWVRTGNVSVSSTTAGAANCNNWTSHFWLYSRRSPRPSDN